MNQRVIVAILVAIVICGCCYYWLPLAAPLGVSAKTWSDQRLSFSRELRLLADSLRDAELSHQTYLATGDKHWETNFSNADESVRHHLTMINNMRVSQPRSQDKIRKLETDILEVMAKFRQSVTDRRTTPDSQEAKQLLADVGQITSAISLLQEDEYEHISEQFLIYHRISTNLDKPLPWLALLFLTALGSLIVFSVPDASDAVKEVDQGGEAGTVKQLRDELDKATEQLERLTHVDFLTELSNIKGLERIIAMEENRAGRAGQSLIAVLINCDNFKQVNDSFGHATGDVILKDVSKRIVGTLRPSDHVARVGGDEFLVILPDTQLAYGLRVAERIRMAVSEHPLHSAQDIINITVSLGVCTLPDRISSVEEVVEMTRSAMRKSKEAGKNKVTLVRDGGREEDAGEEADKAYKLEDTLVDQLLNIKSYRTVYQPIVDFSNNVVAGFEIYSRGPEGAFESPDDFFRLCVENNILTSVDIQCLKLCIETSRQIADNMRVHINLFPSTILETPVENLIALFPEDKSRKKFCIEISEQRFVSEPKHLRDQILALRQAGILVAIDDIGFGRSSLEGLILLEPDVVKVDRKYVTGISGDPAKIRLLRRLSNVTKSLGAEIVAEGIEDREDLPVLEELDIQYGQGFLWGRLLEALPETPEEQRKLIS